MKYSFDNYFPISPQIKQGLKDSLERSGLPAYFRKKRIEQFNVSRKISRQRIHELDNIERLVVIKALKLGMQLSEELDENYDLKLFNDAIKIMESCECDYE